jgi:hypothetical protein
MDTIEQLQIPIDELGWIKAQIADLVKREEALKVRIVTLGPGAHEGRLFRATVTESVRETLDMEAVRAKLSPQFIRAHTRETPVTTVRVVARTAAGLAREAA